MFSRVFGTEFYEVAGYGVNECSTLFFFFLTCYVICFVLLLHYKSSAFLAFLNTVLDTLTHEKEVPLFASIP